MATPFGWASIKGSSVIGNDNGLLVKKTGAVSSGSADVTWDETNKKLTIAGASSSSEALKITGSISVDSITATNITVTNEVYAGDSTRAMSQAGGFGRGNVIMVADTQVVSSYFRGYVYEFEVGTNGTLVVEDNAVIAVETMPTILSTL